LHRQLPGFWLLLVLLILHKWHTRQVDFILSYTQADIELDINIELPAGIKMKYSNGKTHVLKLLKNLYGQKQARWVWPTPYQGSQATWLQAIKSQWMCLLLLNCNLHHVHWWWNLHFTWQ
jgi:hypothetical protein